MDGTLRLFVWVSGGVCADDVSYVLCCVHGYIVCP